MQFSLCAGLTFRDGMRTLELVRELEGGQYQIEDVLTRLPKVISRANLVNAIFNGKYRVVFGSEAAADTGKQWPVVTDLASLSPKEQSQLEFRLRFVKALQRKKIGRGQRHRVSALIAEMSVDSEKKPSASSVMAWVRNYENSGLNPLSLIDRHRLRTTPKRICPHAEDLLWRVLKREYMTPARHSLQHVHDVLTRALSREVAAGKLPEAESAISYATVKRRIDDIDLYQRIAAREGHARARLVCRTSMPDGHAEYPMERIQIDHTPLNWVVVCDRTGLPLGRPLLTFALDQYSSYPLGFYISFHGPGLTSVSGVLRNAILPKDHLLNGLGLTHTWDSYGLGDEWVLDNGLEFHSFGFNKIAQTLGIDVTYCRVRTPWMKPQVERFFGTLNYLTLVRGRVSKTVANIVRIDPYKDAAINFSDLVKGLLMFFVDVYAQNPNWRKMGTPSELYSEGIARCPPAVFPGNLDQFKLASGMSKILTFSQGGIELEGLPYGAYTFKDIANRHGTGLKLLCKWDPDDISILYVQDPDGLRWHEAHCRWKSYAAGMSWNQHRLIRFFARKRLQSPERLQSLVDAKLALHEHWLNSTQRRRSMDAQLAGRYGDMTSYKVLTPEAMDSKDASLSPMAPRALIIPQDLPIVEAEIPDFESCVF